MIVSIRKEEIRMKNFNQMTERQMSNVNGGIIDMIGGMILGLILLGVGVGAGVTAQNGHK